MQLVIDIGNTRVKAAIFDGGVLLSHFIFNSKEELENADFVSQYPITHCIICSVVNDFQSLVSFLSTKMQVLIFEVLTPIPLKNLYQSKATLGSDRIAASVGAYTSYPNKNVLVIDAGTCLKYNFTNDKNEYLGGAISPGMQMRFKALHTFTAKLPLLQADENYNQYIGANTNESIITGVQVAMVKEMDGFIDEYKANYNNLTVVLTGGDANFFEKRLKNSIFANSLLILQGLNQILLYNIKA